MLADLRVGWRSKSAYGKQASDLQPGRALDVGSGEGADTIWLAERGWRVTAVDISSVALERSSALSKRFGSEIAGRIDWLQVDLTAWRPPAASYDLVSAQFMHLPAAREVLFPRLAASVAPGGTLLIVGHHLSDVGTTMPRWMPDLLFTASDVATSLDPHAFEIIVSESRERSAVDPEGRSVTNPRCSAAGTTAKIRRLISAIA